MKNLVLTLTITLISLVSNAQTQITGFGRLQLGMSVNDISELVDAKTISNEREYLSKVYKNKGYSVYEAQIDTLNKYPMFATHSKNVRKFQLGQIKLTDNITLTDVELSFYNDKLYSIQINDDKIDELIIAKYGEGKVTTETKDHTYQNGYGAKFIKTDLKKEINWNTNVTENKCYYITNYWYNSKGEINHYEYASLSNTKISNIVDNELKQLVSRIDKREEEKKKGLVSGF